MNGKNQKTLTTNPPAKLNLFLELLSKRSDGFHEIDTVMVPINWSDTLQLSTTSGSDIELTVEVPHPEQFSSRYQSEHQRGLATIPSDQKNLVHRALNRFRQHFGITGGFHCKLTKRIPAGAGLGGASSDAASALLLAAKSHSIDSSHPALIQLASEIGSDVPFFLGSHGVTNQSSTQAANERNASSIQAARATGRGEIICPVECPAEIHFVVVFPGVGLSTPSVYSHSTVPTKREHSGDGNVSENSDEIMRSSESLLAALRDGKPDQISRQLFNRLSEPAKKLASEVQTTLQSLNHVGLQGCLMTGSGSACFGIAKNKVDAEQAADHLRGQLDSGCIIQVTSNIKVPQPID